MTTDAASRVVAALAACTAVAVGCGPDDRDEPAEPLCEPGARRCAGEYAESCGVNGSWARTFCDPAQDLACDATLGICTGACAVETLGQTYIGCEYFPTITGNVVGTNFHFAIAVSNTSGEAAVVTIERGGLDAAAVFTVEPGDVAVRTLPWIAELKGCMSVSPFACSNAPAPRSARVTDGAYHVRSTRPVTVYQFNPLEYALADEYSYSNDASLLFPVNALGAEYVVAAWPAPTGTTNASPGLVAITATRDETRVTITSPVDVAAGHRSPALIAGMPEVVTLHRGDVLELFNTGGDLTGARVTADAPIQVLSGHLCTNVPAELGFCDHLEDAMLPVSALGTAYVVAAPVVPALPNGKTRVVRIVATADDTFVTLTPPQGGVTLLARAGDFVEIADSSETLHVAATRKVLVAQYMAGQEAGGDMGDPAMVVAVPIAQYRREYLFHAPTNYELAYAEVIAPASATVRLDGGLVVGFVAAPDGTHGVARVVLGPGLGGNHQLSADQPVGLSVYGYGQYTSYWYPGGLDLVPLPPTE